MSKKYNVINVSESWSSPAPEEWTKIPDIMEYKPRASEVSLQRYDGTNICQWHFRTAVSWKAHGPMFLIEYE